MKVLHIIPARGGSKGISDKNIKELCGKPLIYYTIDAAREVSSDENICLSSDSKKIIDVVKEYGLSAQFIRPKHLSTDSTPMAEVINHANNFYLNNGIKYDIISILQPTSPFRKGKHINEALKRFNFDIELMVGVSKSKSNPYYVLFEENNTGFLDQSKKGNFIRRQDCPVVYQLNGAIYLLNSDSIEKYIRGNLSKIKGYIMDDTSSLDIDDKLDWYFAEFMLKNGTIS